jgi:hypothetical protein
MRKFAILIPGSPTPAFYSQIAAISLALKRLSWSRWSPEIYASFGGEYGGEFEAAWHQWRPHLRDVHIFRSSETQFAEMENWSQVDASVATAPRDCDALVCLDADTLPVGNFESVLDRVVEENLVAGVIAHYPVPPGVDPRGDWARWAGLIDRPLDFSHTHTLVFPHEPEERRLAPFYINGGVIAFSKHAFDRFAPTYLGYRRRLMALMENNNFSAQVAFTLAVASEGLATWALPMRYNFPNDPIAEQLHPTELEHVVIHHYLRTGQFDRHHIFASRENYEAFLSLPLSGVNAKFQEAVRSMFGDRYPFD